MAKPEREIAISIFIRILLKFLLLIHLRLYVYEYRFGFPNLLNDLNNFLRLQFLNTPFCKSKNLNYLYPKSRSVFNTRFLHEVAHRLIYFLPAYPVTTEVGVMYTAKV